MRLGSPPKGFANWTLQLLAKQLVQLEIVDSISPETVRKTLKKTASRRGNPVLGDSSCSQQRVRCLYGGRAGHLQKALRQALSRALHGRAAGATVEGNPGSRSGVEEACAPSGLRIRAGWDGQYLHVRRAPEGMAAGSRPSATHQTRLGIGDEGTDTTRMADAEKVMLVCDNLNTHTKGAFYEAFPPEQARALVQRLEFHCTPKHGSWLNIAENELSCMTRQCLKGRRIGDIVLLREETQAWAAATNESQRGVQWQFTIEDARTRLISLYPKIIN